MKIQPVSMTNQNLQAKTQKQIAFSGYSNLSEQILKSDRKGLINIAEFFHTASDKELHQITRTSKDAYKLIKEAIDGVITRKKCYIADGSSFAKKYAEELDSKAARRDSYFSNV